MPVQSRRGYLSFLLFIPLALLLLLPLLSHPLPQSMSGFYLSEQTMNEQIAFKRALLVSAHQKIINLKDDIIIPTRLLEAEVISGCSLPVPRKDPTLFVDLTSIERSCLVRFETLQLWEKLSKEWSAHSDYNSELECLSSSFSYCNSYLYYSHQTNQLTIKPGLLVSLHHKDLNTNATSQLPSMEVGG